jgi:NodT family efflux transporter outer membrane factor (OMF) lipoprotein
MKSEIRNPKAERSSKPEVRDPNPEPPARGSEARGNPARLHPALRPLEFRFGLRASNFFRPSGFGLRFLPLLALLLAGCAVGPDYQRPGVVGTNALPAAFSGATSTNATDWKPAQPSAHLPRGTWWEMFGDSELNRLEGLATTNNQQLAAALANFQQARALVGVARGDFWPQISAAPSFTRQRLSANQYGVSGSSSSGVTYNAWTIPLDATWELDIWGRVRREVEGARANMSSAADLIESTKLSIQAEVAIDYFTLRSLDTQYQVLEETAVAYRRSLELTQNRRLGGIATELDVSLAQTQLSTTEAQVPAVQLQRATMLHALAVLCGQAAPAFEVSVVRGALGAAQKAFDDGPGIPVAVPSELLEHRPDIASAERLMAAANANVGLACAAFYPRLLLNGMAGLASVDASTLFNWESRVWSVGPSFSWPLFTGGRNRAQLAASRAAYDAAVANYRQTVLSAFQDVEDQLAAQRLLVRQAQKERVALDSARRTVDISMDKYKGGVITYLDVVVAQSAALNLEQSMVQLDAQRLAASVSLVKALGAGWTADTGQMASAKPQK